MRHLAAIAVTGSILLASGPAFAGDRQEMRTSKDSTITLKTEGLAPEGAFLSLALPGGGQFYQGDHLRGATYLGATLGLAGGLAAIQFPLFGMFASGEQIAFATVQGLAISWLVMGGISAYDAYQSILAKPTLLQAAIVVPGPGPTASPDPAVASVKPGFEPETPRSTEPVAAPSAAPTQAQPAPLPQPATDAEAIILDSYRLADDGEHWQAVSRLLSISDPSWLPKVRALLTAWGDAAGAQGLVLVREKLAGGDRAAARTALNQLAKLPLKSNLRQQERALRLQLGDRP